jgi:hypothetical protein
MKRSMLLTSIGLGIAMNLGARPWTSTTKIEQERPDPAAGRSARQLPAMPKLTEPVMFNTPEADRILAALPVFPADNPWNEDISQRPVHPNSPRLIASVGPEKSLAYNLDMAFILVPPNQKRVPVRLTE